MIPQRDTWQTYQTPLLLLAGLACCAYLPALSATFFADDDVYLAFTNRVLRDTPWADLWIFFIGPTNPWEFLPIRDLSYWLDFQLYGVEDVGFHLTNLLWYFASGVSAWWLFRELIFLCRTVASSDASALALLGTALFLAHPAHVEVVAWVASRKDLIGGTLGLVAVSSFAMALRLSWGVKGLVTSSLFLLAASFGKATAVAQVLMIAVVALPYSRDRILDPRVRLTAWLLPLGVAILAVVLHYQVAALAGIRIENHIEFFGVIERASRIYAMSIGMLLFPYPLGFYHDVYALNGWHWVVSIVGALLFIYALKTIASRPKLWAFGVVQITVSLVLYLQMVPFTTWSLASERFLFVAVGGLALVAMDVAACCRRPRRVVVLVAMLVVFYSAVAWQRLGAWVSTDRLIAAELVRTPGFHNAKRDLIVRQLLPEGRYEEAALVAESIPRDYIRELLLALIELEKVQRASDGFFSGHASEGRVAQVCQARAILDQKLISAQAHIAGEHDISLNNIIRVIERNRSTERKRSNEVCASRG